MTDVVKILDIDISSIVKILDIPHDSMVSIMDLIISSLVGDRGVFIGGLTTYMDVMDYITISTTGNAIDFGNTTVPISSLAATSNGTNDRGTIGGGITTGVTYVNTIEHITISTPGNAQDFGDLAAVNGYLSSTSNGTNNRGIFGGGYNSGGSNFNTIQYITISSASNTTDFGDLTQARRLLTSTSNATNDRGVFGGGYTSSNVNTIDYITINSAGNATDFGDLSASRRGGGALSNGTNNRGVFAGGAISGYSNIIDYITITSTGNAQDFGDLTAAKDEIPGATSNGTNNRGVIGGGFTTAGINVIDYVTINSAGNAQDFGDLTVARYALAATSNSN